MIKFNKQYLYQLDAYEKITMNNIYSKTISGVSQEELLQIINDIDNLKKAYPTVDDFCNLKEFNIKDFDKRLDSVADISVMRDYKTFKTNMLDYIDNKVWT